MSADMLDPVGPGLAATHIGRTRRPKTNFNIFIIRTIISP
jgi:hypothetical protein